MKVFGHIKTVITHKAIVFRECFACGLIWQGIIHDLSKFSPAELFPSIKYFQGDRSPITAQREAEGYSAAWLHHKGRNRHHWEYWIDVVRDGHIKMAEMPIRYVIEMVCDGIAAGKTYLKESWTTDEPLNFYYRTKALRRLHPDTEALYKELLECIADGGLAAFHALAKKKLK